MTDNKNLPIGVFDSGLGGLTVVHAMQAVLPDEDILYLGDNARVPYGTRSPQTVERYAWNCADFLVQRGLKMLVVACNTASAVAVPSLQQRLDIPVLGVIHAGARAALCDPAHRRIGVIGTAGTVGTGAYPREIQALSSEVSVFQNPAPLLVPLVEEGWIEGEVPRLAVQKYLRPLVDARIDVLLLGCTHYPVLESLITAELAALGSCAQVVNSAEAMTIDVIEALNRHELNRTAAAPGKLQCFVTDLPGSFAEVATRFLGTPVGSVVKVDIS
ncbi:MAG: glutamate racemase [Deltaproteobacteria bacterium]|nr:glutamate racemase [Deltaproteobacteria bacterium]